VIELLSNPTLLEDDLEEQDLEESDESDEEEEEAIDENAGFTKYKLGDDFNVDGEPSQTGDSKDDLISQFDDMVESWLDDGDEEDDMFGAKKKKRKETPQPKSFADQEETTAEDALLSSILCARCYSLNHYGKVKSAEAEGALPGFDFGRVIGTRINMQKFRRSVVLMVVDLGDFDGSLPRAAIKSLLPPGYRGADEGNRLPSTFRLVVAANKSDLLPSIATNLRIENWVRRRMAQGGLPRPSAIHIVSSQKGAGVKGLLADLQAAVGTRGDVWVVGAQNAGKSSLINAMRSAVGLPRERKVTVAPVPGTTLGVIPVPSLLPQGCKMLDTPGVPHEYQLAAYMTADEMKMLLPNRPLKPRTFRLGRGQSVMLGGVGRVDVVDCPGATMYLTVWLSDEVGCHLGKTEGAEERYAKHAGVKLTPPVGEKERMDEFPALKSTEVVLQGDSWKESSMDVAIAGLGWVAVGVGGQAALNVWAPPGVAITTREAMIPDYAKELERPGFGSVITASKAKGKKVGGAGAANKERKAKAAAAAATRGDGGGGGDSRRNRN
jgi:ribosome biogenesis GTPase A